MNIEPLPAVPHKVPPAQPRAGCLDYVLFASASLWIVLATAGIHIVAWFVDQTLLIEGISMPWYAWPLISWAHGLVLIVPVVLLMLLTRAPRLRAAYQTWSLAIAYLFVVGWVRSFSITQAQAAALAQIVLSLLAVMVLVTWATAKGHTLKVRFAMLIPAVAIVPLMIAPSLLWGALGSPVDALLDLLAGLSFGLFAGILIGLFLFGPIARHSSGSGWDLAFGGLVAGLTLVILGGGFGFGGSQLLLLISLPPLGWAVAGLSRLAGSNADDASLGAWLPVAGLIGLAAAAPLMFVDPDELTLLLGGNEIMDWALRAAGLEFALACVAGVLLWALRNKINRAPRPVLSLGGLAVTWLAAALLHVFAGQPGFYGEQLFVVTVQSVFPPHARD